MFMRGGGGMAAGIAVSAVLLYAGIYLVQLVHPLPAGIGARESAALGAYMAQAPLVALLVFLAAWFVAAYGGALAAAKIGGPLPAWFSGALLLLFAIVTVLHVPQPPWLAAGEIVAVVLATYLGSQA